MIHETGTGPQPLPQQLVTVEYYGTFMDGSEFDSSIGKLQPFSFPLGAGAVITGWDEGIGLLNQGSKATFFVPSDLAYGEAGRGSIPPNSPLVFYVELKEVQ